MGGIRARGRPLGGRGGPLHGDEGGGGEGGEACVWVMDGWCWREVGEGLGSPLGMDCACTQTLTHVQKEGEEEESSEFKDPVAQEYERMVRAVWTMLWVLCP